MEGSVGRSVEGAAGYRMSTWAVSIGAGLVGVGIVSSSAKKDGRFGGSIVGGAVGSSLTLGVEGAEELVVWLMRDGAEELVVWLMRGLAEELVVWLMRGGAEERVVWLMRGRAEELVVWLMQDGAEELVVWLMRGGA
jgi:hypothetical protein